VLRVPIGNIEQWPLPHAGGVGKSCNFGRSFCTLAPASFRDAILANGPNL
jgi:hypothetical protein